MTDTRERLAQRLEAAVDAPKFSNVTWPEAQADAIITAIHEADEATKAAIAVLIHNQQRYLLSELTKEISAAGEAHRKLTQRVEALEQYRHELEIRLRAHSEYIGGDRKILDDVQRRVAYLEKGTGIKAQDHGGTEACPECGPFGCEGTERHKQPAPAPDLDKCPKCGGPADNGHDREIPPTPYYCTRCERDQ